MGVVEDLLEDVTEVLAFGEVVEVDGVDFVDDLPHELAGLHVVVGVLKDIEDDASAISRFAIGGEPFERREEVVVDERQQFIAGDPFGVGGPRAPLEFAGDRRAIAIGKEFELLILIVDDLEEEHPAELTDALCVPIDADILTHDVLDGFHEIANGHELEGSVSQGGLHFADGTLEVFARAKLTDEFDQRAHCIERGDLQVTGVFLATLNAARGL